MPIPKRSACAYDAGVVELHAKIMVRIDGKRVETTVGRILLWEIMPRGQRAGCCSTSWSRTLRKRPRALLKKLAGGADFAEVVQSCSQSQDKAE